MNLFSFSLHFHNPAVVAGLGFLLASCSSYEYSSPGIDSSRWGLPKTEIAEPQDSGGDIVVQRGDSLYKIAKRTGVSLRSLIDINGLKPPYTIYPGQRLKRPGSNIHIVSAGETIYGIARQYAVEPGSLVRENDIPPPYRLSRGQKLKIPSGTARTTRQAATTPVPQPVKKTGTAEPVKAKEWKPPRPVTVREPPSRSGPNFLWPVRGRIVVGFGPRAGGLHNDGINIRAPKGTKIRAAENGVVAYAGNQVRGFGNLILIKHSGGWMSAYAHASIIFVKRGDTIRRGQTIARVGQTGNVRDPQLHFELRRSNKPVDPRKYLVRVARYNFFRKVSSLNVRQYPE